MKKVLLAVCLLCIGCQMISMEDPFAQEPKKESALQIRAYTKSKKKVGKVIQGGLKPKERKDNITPDIYTELLKDYRKGVAKALGGKQETQDEKILQDLDDKINEKLEEVTEEDLNWLNEFYIRVTNIVEGQTPRPIEDSPSEPQDNLFKEAPKPSTFRGKTIGAVVAVGAVALGMVAYKWSWLSRAQKAFIEYKIKKYGKFLSDLTVSERNLLAAALKGRLVAKKFGTLVKGMRFERQLPEWVWKLATDLYFWSAPTKKRILQFKRLFKEAQK